MGDSLPYTCVSYWFMNKTQIGQARSRSGAMRGRRRAEERGWDIDAMLLKE